MSKSRLAILTPRSGSQMETFIRNHVEGLPFDITVIYGGYLPWKCDDPKLKIRKGLFTGIVNRVKRRFRSEEELRIERLKVLLKSQKIEVVLAEFILTGAAVAHICKELSIPLIATGLGYELSVCSVLEKKRESYMSYLAVADHTVLVARNMIDTLVELGGEPEKMTWSAAGPSQAFFSIEADCSSQDLFMLGRLVEKKAPHLSILAFSKIANEFPKARLLVGGNGLLLSKCEDLVENLNLENRVVFLGRIDQSKQREILQSARAFIQHSVVASDGDMEGTPVAIVEAAGSGIPVISTLHSGIPDTVIHEKTGFLVAEGDVDMMSSYMKELLSSRKKALEMGAEGRILMNEKFSLDLHLATLTQLIQESIDKKANQ